MKSHPKPMLAGTGDTVEVTVVCVQLRQSPAYPCKLTPPFHVLEFLGNVAVTLTSTSQPAIVAANAPPSRCASGS